MLNRGGLRLLAAMLLCLLVGAGAPALQAASTPALTHETYIWQRLWTPQLLAAMRSSTDIVSGWRILVAEADRAGRWAAVPVPWTDVLATRRPLTAVIRIDGRLDEVRMVELLDQLASRVETAMAAIAVAEPQATLATVEIDYDCPTSKLPLYARFLAALRERLPRSIALSITALPTWMSSAALDPVLAAVDSTVLQVHAVDDPRRGLFDAAEAQRWVAAFSRRSPRPFRVALPAYDVRVSWRLDGRLARVESEVPLLGGIADGTVLGASPEAVRHFLASLQRSSPARFAGIAWFRLPTEADARAWSLPTWRAVIAGVLPLARVGAALMPTEHAGLWSVVLSNDGPVDADLPRQVRLDPVCEATDGANGFRLRPRAASAGGGPLVLEATAAGRLRPQARRVIGWARCPAPGRALDVVP